jgi:nucleotide-binding universal stress UspA family protein
MKKNIQKILIPVDFKSPSVKALHYAGQLAEKTEAELYLLYVIDTPGILEQFFQATDHLVKITDQAKDRLLELAEQIKNERPSIKISTRVEMGKPYKKILEVLKEVDAQMIILGENHQGGDPEDELGTTVYHVTLKSPAPVLTFKGDVSKMKDRIVVPLDLTKETGKQLSAALFYGLEYGATIYLVSVLVGGIKKMDSRIWKKLEDAKETLEMNGVECKMKVFSRSDTPPFEQVLKYTRKVDAGMILLMTHQEGFTYDNYIGAFAHHIMNLSDVSVLSLTSTPVSLDFSPFFKALVDPMGLIINRKKI